MIGHNVIGRSFSSPNAAQVISNEQIISAAPIHEAKLNDLADGVLIGDNITISHDGEKTILENFNLTLRQGEIISILGPSGVGKSSLLRVLGGLERPKSGTITMKGDIITRPHPRLSMAFQNPCLLPWQNVYKNIGFGLNFKHQPKLDKATRHSRIERALHEVGLSSAKALFPAQLSGGMASRVALARCLARQPDVLLLDEPFGALDAITRSQMQALLVKIIADYQSAAVLITHDIAEALKVSDRVLVIGHSLNTLPAHLLGEWHLHAARQSGDSSVLLDKIHNEIMAKLAQ